MHTTAFSIDQQRRRFVIMFAHVSLMHCIKSLMSRTCVLYDVHIFLHQLPNSVVDQVSWSTGLFGGHRPVFSAEGAGLFREHKVTPERAISVAAI